MHLLRLAHSHCGCDCADDTVAGVLVLNLVCRDQSLKTSIMADIKRIFKSAFVRTVSEEVNEVVFALPQARRTDLTLGDGAKAPAALVENLKTLHTVAQTNAARSEDVMSLTYKLSNMKML